MIKCGKSVKDPLTEAATGGVLKNFAKFVGNYLRRSLVFNKILGLRPATLFKKSLCHRCFLENFAKVLRRTFDTEHFHGTPSAVNLLKFADLKLSMIQALALNLNRWESPYTTETRKTGY